MRTVTFYSYKGGTGRTLLLANVAILAARMGWGVVAIDVDMEAPGLAYKLLDEPPTRCDGLIGWLCDCFAAGEAPPSLADSLIDVPVRGPFDDRGWLKLMPAGRNPSLNYFQDLMNLELERRIKGGEGVNAFLDLKARIEADLAPDFLLLDARTGISSTNLVTTRVLADDIVALTLDNREQLEGTRSILRSLTPLTSLGTDEPLRLHVVLSRIATRSDYFSAVALTESEQQQIERVRSFLRAPADPLPATLTIDDVLLLHTEPALVRREFLVLAGSGTRAASTLQVDCLYVAKAVLGEAGERVLPGLIDQIADLRERRMLRQVFAARRGGVGAPAGAEPETPAQEVEGLEQRVRVEPTLRPILARAHVKLAEHLVSERRSAEAVAPAERAVELFELEVAETPQLRTSLASALDSLGVRYRVVGRMPAAVACAERAVDIYDRPPAESPTGLASALSNLAISFSEVRQSADALAAAERSVEISEKCAASVSAPAAALGVLGTSLRILANRLADVGRLQDALIPAERSVRVHEWDVEAADEAAGDKPTSSSNAGLALSLHELGLLYVSLERRDDAAAQIKRAVEIYERLAASDSAVLEGSARALKDYGKCLAELGRYAEALLPAEGAMEAYQALATSNHHAFLGDLAASLSDLGRVYGKLDRHAEAVEFTQRAVAMFEELAARDAAVEHALSSAREYLARLHAQRR